MGDSRLGLNPDIRTEQGLKGPIGLSLGDNWYARTTRYVVTMCREMKGGLNVYEVGEERLSLVSLRIGVATSLRFKIWLSRSGDA